MNKNFLLITLFLAAGYFDTTFAMDQKPARKVVYTREQLLALKDKATPFSVEMEPYLENPQNIYDLDCFFIDFINKNFEYIDQDSVELFKANMKSFFDAKKFNLLMNNKALDLSNLKSIIVGSFETVLKQSEGAFQYIFNCLLQDLLEFFKTKYDIKHINLSGNGFTDQAVPPCVLYFPDLKNYYL